MQNEMSFRRTECGYGFGGELEQTFTLQAQIILVANNNMVQDFYTRNLPGLSQPLRQHYVIFRGFVVTRRVIVHEDAEDTIGKAAIPFMISL